MDSRSTLSIRTLKLDDEEREDNFTKPAPYISCRPFNCPVSDCHRLMSINAVGSHFKHEHHNVPKHYMTYDQTEQIRLSLERLVPGKTYCSAVLLIHGKDENPKTMQIDNFAVILVLTTRLKCIEVETSAVNPDAPTCSFSYDLPSIPRSTDAPRERYSSETIAIWLTTLVPGDKEGIITGVNQETSATYKYSGAVHSIRDSNNIADILPKGHHLMLLDTNLNKQLEKGLHLFDVTIKQKKLRESCS